MALENQRNVERAERDASQGPQVLSRSGELRDDRRTRYRGGVNWGGAGAGGHGGDVRGVQVIVSLRLNLHVRM